MTTTHTPGPWMADSHYPSVSAPTSPNLSLCNDHAIPMSERIANARLIAAAPDLLAALEAIFGIALDGKSHFHSAELIRVMGKERFDAARAALAKATGEQA